MLDGQPPIVKRRTVSQGRYDWMTKSDWTDFTLMRLSWKLDEAKKHPDLLQGWERATIFAIFKEAKKVGPDYRLTGKRFEQARDILRARPGDAGPLIE